MNAATSPETTAAVDAAIASRRSVRGFLPTPVPREVVEDILRVASRAPSGTNTQPWHVTVLTGPAKSSRSAKIRAVHDDPDARAQHREEYDYYPADWASPYIERRRKVGWDLYGLLGIGRSDKAGMHRQHGRNYAFFDAPVGLMFTIGRSLRQGSWLDYGMFLQTVMIAARGRGLQTCPQAAFMRFHRIIMQHIGAPANQMFVCGMSLGHADEQAVANRLVTVREPVSAFTRSCPERLN
jgi:nitroreductase